LTIWSTYRQLLENRALTRLLIGEFVSSIGDWLYLVALVVLVYRETGDPVLLGIVGAARLIPYFVLSIPAGLISDRFDRRLVLLVSDLGRAVCMVVLAALVFADSGILPIAVVAFVATCFSAFFYPAFGAYMPSLVRDEAEFGPANSAWATLDNLAWVIGPGIAGLILLAGNLELAFILNAITFGIIGWVLWSLPPSKPTRAAQPTTAPAAASDETLAGRPARSSVGPRAANPAERVAAAPRRGRPGIPAEINVPAVSGIIVLDALAWLAFGGINILIVILAIVVFRAGDEATGFLNVAIGVGGTIGAIVSGVLVLRTRLAPALLVAGAAFSLATVLLGVAPALSIAFVAVATASVGHLVLDVARTTIFQRVVPDAYRGRFTGILMTTSTASEALGTLIVPILIGAFDIAIVLGFIGGALFAATLLAIALIGHAADLVEGPYDADLRRIARLPLFGGLSPARIEAALRKLEPIQVQARTVVIRQGEPADRFYVIGSGSFEVSQAGPDKGPAARIRTLGRHDVFGERGLIAQARRTATVTAKEPGLLFAMDAPDFLALVSGRRGVAERFLALYDAPGSTDARATPTAAKA
jgi:MFS family permease